MVTHKIINKGSQLKTLVKFYLRRQFKEFSLPDFLIIGAQKCGTTSLYSYLSQHPGIIAAKRKEIHYFGNPYNRIRGKSWYAAHFCTVSYKKSLETKLGYLPITREASTHLHKPLIPKFIHDLLPYVKLVAILRNPADRAFSQYHHNRFHGSEPLAFEEAIAKSPIRIPDELMRNPWFYHNSDCRSYIYRGLYAEQLENWYQYFSKDRIHIINSEDFFADPITELKKVLLFLGLPDHQFDTSMVRNKGRYKMKMSNDVREYLISIYRPHNRRLFELIGRDFGWPS